MMSSKIPSWSRPLRLLIVLFFDLFWFLEEANGHLSEGVAALLKGRTSAVGGLITSRDEDQVLRFQATPPGKAIKQGITLRILCAGDSITVGFPGQRKGRDGNGYRKELRDCMPKDQVVFAGTETANQTMDDGFFTAFNGKTIQSISSQLDASLLQRPNIVLLHAGTNDMNPIPSVSTEGTDPAAAASRLGALIDKITAACPDAVVLVAVVIPNCSPGHSEGTSAYQHLIPGVVAARRRVGKHVLAVDFSTFPEGLLYDCIHPSDEGYKLMGRWWYDFIVQVPEAWIGKPVGENPRRGGGGVGAGEVKAVEVVWKSG